MRMCLSIFWILTSLLVGAVAVTASEPPTVPATAGTTDYATDEAGPETIPPLLKAPAARDAGPQPFAGLRVFVDPVTGELVANPTRAQIRELTRTLAKHRFEQGIDPGANWSPEGLARFELPAGGTGVNLGGRFLTSTVVHRGPDGELHFECTHDPHEVQEQPGTTRNTTPGAALK